MKQDVAKRKQALKKKSRLDEIEAKCLDLECGEFKEFTINDLNLYGSIIVRLSRLKQQLGFRFKTETNGNQLTVTRE